MANNTTANTRTGKNKGSKKAEAKIVTSPVTAALEVVPEPEVTTQPNASESFLVGVDENNKLAILETPSEPIQETSTTATESLITAVEPASSETQTAELPKNGLESNSGESDQPEPQRVTAAPDGQILRDKISGITDQAFESAFIAVMDEAERERIYQKEQALAKSLVWSDADFWSNSELMREIVKRAYLKPDGINNRTGKARFITITENKRAVTAYCMEEAVSVGGFRNFQNFKAAVSRFTSKSLLRRALIDFGSLNNLVSRVSNCGLINESERKAGFARVSVLFNQYDYAADARPKLLEFLSGRELTSEQVKEIDTAMRDYSTALSQNRVDKNKPKPAKLTWAVVLGETKTETATPPAPPAPPVEGSQDNKTQAASAAALQNAA